MILCWTKLFSYDWGDTFQSHKSGIFKRNLLRSSSIYQYELDALTAYHNFEQEGRHRMPRIILNGKTCGYIEMPCDKGCGNINPVGDQLVPGA